MTKETLRPLVSEVYGRLAKGALLPDDVVALDDVKFQTAPHWLTGYDANGIFEQDAMVFRRFRKDMGTILDIGAHWGYMALSIRRAGTDCPIVSFEAMAAHRPCLEELKRLDNGGYDYLIAAVSDSAKTVTLYGPVVNGIAVDGLNSIDGVTLDVWHVDSLASLVGSAIPVAEKYKFQLLKTKLSSFALDEILLRTKFDVPTGKIAAIKIDVEGHEGAVLNGAQSTISLHRPMMVTEWGNNVPEVADFMLHHGYRSAERKEDQIIVSDRPTEGNNGYWFHETRRSEYEAMGFLIEKPHSTDFTKNAMHSLTYKRLAKYLISTLGEDGIVAAATRMNGVAGEVAEAVQKWESKGEITALVNVVTHAVNVIDSYDLRYKEIPLRIDLEKYSGLGGLWDPAPRSCILNALIEAAEPGEDKAESILVQIASYRTQRRSADADFNAALALAMRFTERGRFDDALAILEGNFAAYGMCAASQYHAFQAYAGKEARGERIENKRVTTDDFSRKFCPAPFETLSTVPWVRLTGKPIFYACGCARYLPYPISATDEVVDLEEEWNGAHIQELRRSILDGDFKYCGRGACGFLLSGNLPNKEDVTDPIMRDVIDNHKTFMDQPPRVLLLSHDASCNIACPSCRPGIITSKNAEREAMDAFADRVLVPFLANAGNGQITLDICGDGDPFGSKHYRRLIHSLDPERHKHVRLRLTTNGLLLTKREWEELGPIRDMILEIKVSIDAATAPTYENVRRPGKWATLVENMEHLAQVLEKEPYKFYFSFNFVVQKANYRELPDIVRLAKSWNARRVLFQRISNIYNRDDFLSHDVFDPRHPDHADFLRVLSDPVLRDPIVDLWQLGTFVDPSNGQDQNGLAEQNGLASRGEGDIVGHTLGNKVESAPIWRALSKSSGIISRLLQWRH